MEKDLKDKDIIMNIMIILKKKKKNKKNKKQKEKNMVYFNVF